MVSISYRSIQVLNFTDSHKKNQNWVLSAYCWSFDSDPSVEKWELRRGCTVQFAHMIVLFLLAAACAVWQRWDHNLLPNVLSCWLGCYWVLSLFYLLLHSKICFGNLSVLLHFIQFKPTVLFEWSSPLIFSCPHIQGVP